MSQLDELQEALGRAINDKPNADYHIRGAREKLTDVQEYVRALEMTVDTLGTRVVKYAAENEELRKKL